MSLLAQYCTQYCPQMTNQSEWFRNSLLSVLQQKLGLTQFQRYKDVTTNGLVN